MCAPRLAQYSRRNCWHWLNALHPTQVRGGVVEWDVLPVRESASSSPPLPSPHLFPLPCPHSSPAVSFHPLPFPQAWPGLLHCPMGAVPPSNRAPPLSCSHPAASPLQAVPCASDAVLPLAWLQHWPWPGRRLNGWRRVAACSVKPSPCCAVEVTGTVCTSCC